MPSKPRTIQHWCSHCGCEDEVIIPDHIKDKRSRKEHNVLFGYIGLCCDNWPEQYDYQPANNDPEHLRGWVLIRIGHCRELVIPKIDKRSRGFLKVMAAFIADDEKYFETTIRDGIMRTLIARSIRTGKGGVDRKTYNRITNSVQEVLEPICGISIEDYKHHKKTMSPAEEPAHEA